ncbi:MAG: T9SS type A sorting domain-containing protein [Saprospiraceae bacterium]|nr:T9SS type A sorting domain-containing protein [Saprospiraceae bacterium]
MTGGKVKLKDSTEYIVAIEYREPMIDPWKNAPLDILLSREYDYSFNRMLTGSTEVGGLEFCNPSYGGFLNIGLYDNVLRSDELPFYRIPVIRMNLQKITSINNLPLDGDNRIGIVPNPISDLLSVDMDFAKSMDQVNIRISDITGKTMMDQTLSGVQQTIWTQSVSSMANGSYIITISTPQGVRTEKFVIQH